VGRFQEPQGGHIGEGEHQRRHTPLYVGLARSQHGRAQLCVCMCVSAHFVSAHFSMSHACACVWMCLCFFIFLRSFV